MARGHVCGCLPSGSRVTRLLLSSVTSNGITCHSVSLSNAVSRMNAPLVRWKRNKRSDPHNLFIFFFKKPPIDLQELIAAEYF